MQKEIVGQEDSEFKGLICPPAFLNFAAKNSFFWFWAE
jgi:hypothetical protein